MRGNSFANGPNDDNGPGGCRHDDGELRELLASQCNQFRDGQ